MSAMIDNFLIRHGMTHPPLWLMWVSIVMSYAAFMDIIVRRMRKK